jgi:hypothetical protein
MVKTAIRNVMKKVGFYANRLRKENVTKVIAASAASLALVLQLTVGVVPFTGTTVNAAGDDNIIRNGISSKDELLAMYDSGSDNAGHTDIKKIYTHFGVSRQDIANMTMGTYKTNDFNGQIKSIGRTNWPNAGRTAVQVTDSSTTVYTGPFLDNANAKAFTMPALIGKRSVDGQWFAVTLNCGNIVYTVTPPPVVTPPPAPKPVSAVCTELTATRTSRTKVKFDTDYTLGTDKFKSITYVVSDETGTEISRSSNATYTQSTSGTYSVEAIVTVTDANGKVKTITSDDCVAQFKILSPPVTPISTTPKKCTIVGKENLPESSPDCKEVVPTEMCTVVGKENLPKASPDCVEVTVTPTEMCQIVGKENLPKNSPDCVVAPVVTPPQELPKTGLGEDVLKVTGVGSLIAAIGYYAASRRGLLGAFLNQ